MFAYRTNFPFISIADRRRLQREIVISKEDFAVLTSQIKNTQMKYYNALNLALCDYDYPTFEKSLTKHY